MGNFSKNTIFTIIILIFCFFSKGIAEDQRPQPVNFSHPAVKAFLAMQDAIRNEDYEKAWQLLTKKRQEKFNNSLDDFKQYYSKSEKRKKLHRGYRIFKRNIKEVEPLTPNKVALVFDVFSGSGYPKSVYMVLERGGWKVDGRIHKRIRKVKDDLGKLSKALREYYIANQRYPSTLYELVPNYIAEILIDLFNEENKPYAYRVNRVTGDTWELYSFGPDMDDDLGIIEYDVKKGIISNGDLVLRSSIEKAHLESGSRNKTLFIVLVCVIGFVVCLTIYTIFFVKKK